MKAITKLQIDLTRIVPVKSAEGLAIVELHATVGDVTVALLLGHKDLRMAARYQHLSPAFLADAVARLDTVFGLPRHHSVTVVAELAAAEAASA